jgi:hypothetical protein
MDRLLRWVRDIKQATYFDIQNVADYYFQYPEEKWDSARDFTVAPPFNFFATRYTVPDSAVDIIRGMEMLTVFRVVEKAPISTLTVHGYSADINPHPPALVPGARWHIFMQIFSTSGRQVAPPVDWFLAVDELGQIARYGGHIAMWVVDTHQDAGVAIMADSLAQVNFLALTFMHCKNVQVLNPPPPSKKRLPRKKKFESRYHRLKIEAIGQKRESAPGSRTGIQQSLHIVRGHFREYGEEFGKGKLFGKFSGRYWVAAHTSGSPATGVVTKDYQVEAPRKENLTNEAAN